MPWLVGTALIHSLAVSEKRGTARSWTLLLAIFAFSLSLLGTFLVRSGVITSVHAFATDPTRGVFILVFLGIVVGGSLSLYAWRAPGSEDHGRYGLLSRETLLLTNSVLFVVAAASVLLGTIYPLILDALRMGKISVGPPYFNAVFVPLMVPVAVLMGIGPLIRWKQQAAGPLIRRLWPPAAASIALGVLIAVSLGGPSIAWVALGFVLAAWVALSIVQDLIHQTRNRRSFLRGLFSLRRGYYGMTTAHFGVAVFIVGVTMSANFSVEKDVRMAPGERIEAGGYEFLFEGSRGIAGPNYSAQVGTVSVYDGDQQVATLRPEKRIYRVQRNAMTEAAIDPGLSRDLYVALGEPLEGGAWSMRVYAKPFQRLIWLGGLLMALGGFLAATDPRYRRATAKAAEQRPAGAPDATPA